jgi:hypothetical protein
MSTYCQPLPEGWSALSKLLPTAAQGVLDHVEINPAITFEGGRPCRNGCRQFFDGCSTMSKRLPPVL